MRFDLRMTVAVWLFLASMWISALHHTAHAVPFDRLEIGSSVADGQIDFGRSKVVLPSPAADWRVVAAKRTSSLSSSGDRITTIKLRSVVLVRVEEGRWAGLIEVGGLGEYLTWAPWMTSQCTSIGRTIFAEGINRDKFKPTCLMVTSSFLLKDVGTVPGVFQEAMDWLKDQGVASPEFVHLGRLVRYADGNYSHMNAYLSADVHPADSVQRMMAFLAWMKSAAMNLENEKGRTMTLGQLEP